MGQAKKRSAAFFAAHPKCAFCGGERDATTREHCPPRALFQHRVWPEGFEFPACEECNAGTRGHDLVIAFLGRMDPFEDSGDDDGKLVGYVQRIDKLFPHFLASMLPSAAEARRLNRWIGVEPGRGMTHQETGIVKIPTEMQQCVEAFARKLAKGVYYMETGVPFPNAGCLLFSWFTNANLIKDRSFKIFELLKDIYGKALEVKRDKTYLGDQFELKVSLSPDQELLVIQARFGKAFGLVIFGSSAPGKLESLVQRLGERTGKPMRWKFCNRPFSLRVEGGISGIEGARSLPPNRRSPRCRGFSMKPALAC